MRGRSQSSGALDYRATPGWCRAGEAPRILCSQWGFEIDKGRTPPIFWHPKMKRNNEVRWVSYCSFLEVVLVARDSCRKKSSGISGKPLALTEGSCTLHVSPCPLASELEETILGSICWTRCFTLLPNPDTMTCWDGGCIRLICVGFPSSYDFHLEILKKWLYAPSACFFHSHVYLLAVVYVASCSRSNQSCNWCVSSQGQRISRVEVQVERQVAQRSLL